MLKVAENIRGKPIVGNGRSSQQGNEDRITTGLLSRNTFDGLWQFEEKDSQLIVVFSAVRHRKIARLFAQKRFQFDVS